jgi:hypothetical protein
LKIKGLSAARLIVEGGIKERADSKGTYWHRFFVIKQVVDSACFRNLNFSLITKWRSQWDGVESE